MVRKRVPCKLTAYRLRCDCPVELPPSWTDTSKRRTFPNFGANEVTKMTKRRTYTKEFKIEALKRAFSTLKGISSTNSSAGGGTRTHTGHRSQRIFFSLWLSLLVSWTFSSPRRVSPVKSLHLPDWAWLRVASQGFPEFEGIHFVGFPTNAQNKSVASASSATPACLATVD